MNLNLTPKNLFKKKVCYFFLCMSILCSTDVLYSQVSGTVFEDFNFNGIREAVEVPFEGVKVVAYDSSNSMVGMATSAFDGTYSIPGVNGQVRIEFTNLPIYAQNSSGRNSKNGNSVRFINAPLSNVDFALQVPSDYCQDTMTIAFPCYVAGNPLGGGTSGNVDAFVAIPYGVANNAPSTNTKHMGDAIEIGATWGTAYDPDNRKLYTSALLKRHAGFGPLGIDGIYVTNIKADGSNGDFSNFIKLSALGIVVDDLVNPRNLPVNANQPSYDNEAFQKVGSLGLGDIEIDPVTNTLYVVVLSPRQLVKISLGANHAGPYVATSYPIPDPGCNKGDFRPWALDYYRGKLYVGGICDAVEADNSGTKNDLDWSIYEFDVITESFNASPLLSGTLNQNIDYVHGWSQACTEYGPWTVDLDDWNQVMGPKTANTSLYDGGAAYCNPQPIFSDIEVDNDGSFQLSFMDRNGHTGGPGNYRYDPSMNNTSIFGFGPQIGGIVQYAQKTGSNTWVLESNGKTLDGDGAGANSATSGSFGIGDKQYYNGLNYGYRPTQGHGETNVGGIVQKRGSDHLVVIGMDPIRIFSNGIYWMNNKTGAKDKAYEVFVTPSNPSQNASGSFSKANGLGEPELLCSLAPIEIGNYIWVDNDRDGIQDPEELPILGVVVKLYNSMGTLVGTTSTAADGSYYFNSKDFPLLLPEMTYHITVGEGQYANDILTIMGIEYALTTALATSALDQDTIRDSDGSIISGATMALNGLAGATITTGVAGSVDHTIDFGFYPLVHDVALSKALVSPLTPVTVGTEISYNITVSNQGTVPLDSLIINEYIGTGYNTVLPISNTEAWTAVIGGVSTLTLATSIGSPSMPLLPGNSLTIPITLEVIAGANLTNLANQAEIGYSRDTLGKTNLNDIDSDADNDPNNDAGADGSSVGGSADNEINGNGTGNPDDNNPATDEDDADPAQPLVQDLALSKLVDPNSPDLLDGMISANEFITFNILVMNQGNVTMTNIEVKDTFPCGLIFDPTMSPLWTGSGTPATSATTTIASLAPGASVLIPITMQRKSEAQLITDCGPSAPVVPGRPFANFAFINAAQDDISNNVTEDIDSEFGSFTANEQGTMPNMPGDNDVLNSGDAGTGSQDDADPADINVFDLALAKVLTSPVPSNGFKVGNIVQFNICITSQGNIAADSIIITDYIPAGLMYVSNANNIMAGWSGSGSTVTNLLTGTSLPGASLTFLEQKCVPLELQIVGGQTDFVNRAEISYASGLVPLSGGSFMSTPFANDNDGSFDADPNNDSGGNPTTPSDAMTTLVSDPAILGNGTGQPNDTNPLTDDDDADPALVPIVDFALRKVLLNTDPISIGDTVGFGITVFNQGNISGAQFEINDYVPSHLFFDQTLNAGWLPMTSGSGLTVMKIIPGPIAPGDSAFMKINLVVLPNGTTTMAYSNHAEIFRAIGVPGETFGTGFIAQLDIDSNVDTNPFNDAGSDASSSQNGADNIINGTGNGGPDDGIASTDEDDADPAFVPIHDVALVKLGPVGAFDIGQTVTFNITITNQGNQAIDSIVIADYIPSGYTFMPNNNWVATSFGASLTATITNGLLPLSGIAPLEDITFPIDLVINATANSSNLTNVSEIIASKDVGGLDGSFDDDSDPDNDPSNDNVVVIGSTDDNNINGGGPNANAGSTDEDDSDPASVALNYYSVGNQIWVDINNNGVVDLGETPIENVIIELLVYNNTTMMYDYFESDTSDANGLYLFDSLSSGKYLIVIPSSNFTPAFGSIPAGALFNYASSTGAGFASTQPGSGIYEMTNPIDGDSSTDQDDNGIYMNTGIFSGSVISDTIMLANNNEPLTEAGPDNDPSTPDQRENLTIDFGFIPLLSVGSNVFADNDNDGLDDGTSDQGISGVTVQVYSTGTDGIAGTMDDILVGMDITDGNGDWYVDSLLPGEYYALINTPDASFPTSSTPDLTADGVDENDNGSQVGGSGTVVTSNEFTLTGDAEPLDAVEIGSGGLQDASDDNNGDMTIDFGFAPYVSVGSNVFADNDNDGLDDGTSDQGISGVTVQVYSTGTDGIAGTMDDILVGMDITDGNGDWYVDSLLPGEYYALINTPDASFPTSSTPNLTADGVDENDNGSQIGGSGTVVTSNEFTLTGDAEPLDAVEIGSGGMQDAADDNNGDMTIDFGFAPYVSVGSNVFADNDNDGLDDGTSDQGISGVTVQVYSTGTDGIAGTMDDMLVGMDITDGNGDWYVDSLLPGEYYALINTPDASFPTSSTPNLTADGVDENDNGSQVGGSGTVVTSNEFTLTGDAEPLDAVETGSGGMQDASDDNNGDMTIDFGFAPYVSVGSNVFADNDNDGLDDGTSDQGISGVTVQVYSTGTDGIAGTMDDILVGMDITDGNGDWYVDSLLPGEYFALINTPDASFPTSSTPNLTADGVDENDNGSQIGGSGTVVTSNEFTLTGDAEPLDGSETGSGGMQDAADDNNGDMTIDFGFAPYVSVGSNVFADNDNDGLDDGTSDQGISGVTVQVYSTGTDGIAGTMDDILVGMDITDGNGDWYVDSLLPGEYYALINTPDASFPTSSTPDLTADGVDENDNGSQIGGSGTVVTSNEFTLTGDAEPLDAVEIGSGGLQDASDDNNGDMTIDFGFAPYVSVGSNVFADNDNDGLDDGTSDQGISGVTVQVYSTGTDGIAGTMDDMLVGMDITDGNGDWYVDSLLPGEYYALINTPDASFPTSSTPNLTADGVDENDNGSQVGGSGTVVTSNEFTLTGDAEPLDAVEIGSGGMQDAADDNNGDMTIDFGFAPYVSVGSNVFADNDNDGLDDGTSDQGISGVTVQVYSTGTDGLAGTMDDILVGMDITDGNGDWYVDSLLPGEYYALINTPDASFPTSSTPNLTADGVDENDNGSQVGGSGTEVTSNEFTLTGDAEPLDGSETGSGGMQDASDDNNGDMTIDFGFAPYVSVGSNVFADNDNDGLDDGTSDQGISGVTVQVYSTGTDGIAGTMDDILVGMDITDGNGDWYVDSLLPGEYYALINTPDASFPTSSTPNLTADGVDENDNGSQVGGSGTVVTSNEFTLTGDAEPLDAVEIGSGGMQDASDDNNGDMTIDFGFAPYVSVGSNVFADNDNDGLDDGTSDQGISGVTVQVYSTGTDGIAGTMDDMLVGMDITDGNGDWYVDSLLPGEYYALINTPDASFPTSSTPNLTADGVDENDNGSQVGGSGTVVTSNEFTLTGDAEPLDAVEIGSGGMQDASDDNNGDMTIDFGFAPYVSVGSNVFADNDNDGLDDGTSDQGISGVTVQVYSTGTDGLAGTMDDILVGMDITDGNGDWYVDSLLPGEYYALINTPDASFPTSSTPNLTADGVDENDNGSQIGGSGTVVTSNEFTLTGDAEPLDAVEIGSGGMQDASDDNNGDMTIDFGFAPYVSVGSNVFADNDNDGLDDGTSDQGISGVTVQVYSTGTDGIAGTMDDMLVGMDITDGNGDWYVDSLLPGEYYALINTPDASFPTSSTPNLTADGVDENDNGSQIGGSGTEVTSNEFTLTGDAEPLDAVEIGSGGLQDASDDNNGDMTIDFGFAPYVSVGSNVFADNDNDGLDDGTSDQGISGVTVQVYSTGTDGIAGTMDDMLVGMDITDGNGDWYVDSLLPGEYYALINTPDASFPTSSTPNLAADGVDENDNGSQVGGSGTVVTSNEFTLTGDAEPLDAVEIGSGGLQDASDDNNGDMTIDFGFAPYVSVGSNVFADNDNDGLDDGTSDQGISGVTVQVYSTGTDGIAGTMDDILVGMDITDGNGDWYVDSLLPGEYYALINTPDASFPTSSTPDLTADGVDENDNGSQIGGSGTVVTSNEFTLTGDAEPLDGAETGSGGMQDASDDNNGDMTIDFGFAPYVSVGSNVFADNDNDGLDDGTSDQGISGVTVQVYSTGTDGIAGTMDDILVGMDITDGNGDWYVDSLLPGEYYSLIITPSPTYPTSSTGANTTDSVDNNDNGSQVGGSGTVVTSNEFTLTGDAEPLDAVEIGSAGMQDASDDNNGDMTIDFGFVPFFSLGNQVWIDFTSGGGATNYDGVRNGSEIGINGVTVQLYTAAGALVQTTTTMTVGVNQGMYLFDSLLPGDYIVVIPGSQSMPGGPLANYLSSSGTFNAGGPYELPAGIDPDNNIDNTDDGTFNSNAVYPFAVVSNPVTLGGMPEPLGENPDNDIITLDQYENLTIDFGFIPKVYDLALRKTTMAMQPIDAFNMQIEFMIEVFNQGNMVAQDIEITDYIASGFSYLAAQNNPIGWSLSGNTATRVLTARLNPGASTQISLFLSIQMSNMSNAFVNHAEISNMADTLGNTPDGGPYGSLVDIDSSPDTNPSNDDGADATSAGNSADNIISGNGKSTGNPDDGNPSTDEDDADPALVEVVDVAIRKTIITPAPYTYGQAVTYHVKVFNQGNVPLYNIKVNDYIPSGLAFNAAQNTAWLLSGSTAMTTIPGPLNMWDSVTIPIVLVPQAIVPASNASNMSWTNVSEVAQMFDQSGTDLSSLDVDSNADSNSGNDSGGVPNTGDDNNLGGDGNSGGDEDDSDPAMIALYDLALTKTMVNPTAIYLFGDLIPMNITITNQGNSPAYNVVVKDYVPESLTNIGAGANTGWTFMGNMATYTIAGPIAPGATIVVPLNMVFQAASAIEDYINYAEISDFSGGSSGPIASSGAIKDADSTPDVINGNDPGGVADFPGSPSGTDNTVNGENGDEDDHDPLLLGFVDMALTKITNTLQADPGDIVSFTINVTNQGTIPTGSITINDYIPAGFTLADPSWNSISATQATKTVSVANGDFAAPGLQYNQTVTTTIMLMVNNTTLPGAYTNFAEINTILAPNGEDITSLDIDSDGDSNPSNDGGGNPEGASDNTVNGDGTGMPGSDNADTDEDDHDPAVICVTPRPDIQGDFFVCPEDIMTYTLTYFNPANIYTWIVEGPASIIGSNNGQSVQIQFSDAPGQNVVVRIVEETGYEFCKGIDMQVVVIEKILGLACDDLINLSLGTDCTATLTPSTILEGQIYPDESFSLVIKDASGNIIPQPLTSSVIGKKLTVSVIQDCFGSSCWGNIIVEDKLAPKVECPQTEFTFKCYDLAAFKSGKLVVDAPVATDCSEVIKTFTDQINENGNCQTLQIRRIWTIKDKWGNVAPNCSQLINFETLSINDITLPPAHVEMNSCGSGITPADVSAYFDIDSRSGSGIGAFNDDWTFNDGSPEGVVEWNEGFAYGYPHYYTLGKDGKLHAQKIDQSACNISAVYKDELIDACGSDCPGNTKVIRTWTILDWCTGETVKYIQVIKAVDNKPPTFIVKDITASVSPWGCVANINVPSPWELADNCDAHPKWWIEGPAGVTITGNMATGFIVSGVAKGVHQFIYKAGDCCGNLSSIPAYFTVIDRSAPVAIAKQNIVASLTGSGTGSDGAAKVFATSVDNGSYDHCSDVKIEIRRTDGGSCGNVGLNDHNNNLTYNNDASFTPGVSWAHPEDNKDDDDNGAYVKFCCEDLDSDGRSKIHQVMIRVWDDGNMNGVIGDNLIIDGMQDNYNETWADVKVENKLAPTIVCPADITVKCDTDIKLSTDWSLSNGVNLPTGKATAFGLCTGLGVEYKDNPTWINTCKNVGRIRREFRTVSGDKVVSCFQTITVESMSSTFIVTPPSTSIIEAPCNFDASHIKVSDKPKVQGGPCDVIGENISIDTFYLEDGVCKKWKVSYTYINWCTNEEKGPFVKYYKYKDDIKPVLVCQNQMFAANPSPLNPNGECEANVILESSATDEGGCISGGWLKWNVIVDLWGNGTNDYEFSSFLPSGDNNIGNDTNGNGIPDRYVAPTADGQNVKLPAFILNADMSTHKVTWKVTDGCGNITSCNTTFMVVDKKAPTPYCVSISTAIMENGQVELWAIDFNKGSFDNCSPQNALLYTFNGVQPVLTKIGIPHYFKGAGIEATVAEYSAGNAQRWVPEYRSSAMIFNCDDVAASPLSVNMSVWDGKYNTDYCTVTLTIIDNQGACNGAKVAIGGDISTEKGQGIKNVNVELNSILNGYPKNQMSDFNGNYMFTDLPMNMDYTIKGIKRDDWTNGVSTIDLVHIQRHVLGVNKLDSPYKLVAADANSDGKVSASDIVILRKLILGTIGELPNNNSWKFLNAQTPITNASSPWPIDEIITISPANSNMMKENFIGVKIGDVNNNASTVHNEIADNRSNSILELISDDKEVIAGEVISLPITSKNFNEIFGYQFSMTHKNLDIVNVHSGILEINTDHYGAPSSGIMTMSWSSDKAMSVSESDVLFTIVLKANKAGRLSEMIQLNSDITKAESYAGSTYQTNRLTLTLSRNLAQASPFVLGQNEPNPFTANTIIAFSLPDASKATITITDVSGKLINVKHIDAIKGINKVEFNRKDIPVSGILYYTLSTEKFKATKAMIVIE